LKDDGSTIHATIPGETRKSKPDFPDLFAVASEDGGGGLAIDGRQRGTVKRIYL
jgi:hypothetical protein